MLNIELRVNPWNSPGVYSYGGVKSTDLKMLKTQIQNLIRIFIYKRKLRDMERK